MHGRKRVEKRKTTTKTNTLNPYYKESFDFDVSPERVKVGTHVVVDCKAELPLTLDTPLLVDECVQAVL